jgi:hypothetical protein
LNVVAQDSPEARELVERAQRLSADADRAFAKLMNGEVKTSAAAVRLQRKADEAWADVRFGIVDGADVEWRGGLR